MASDDLSWSHENMSDVGTVSIAYLVMVSHPEKCLFRDTHEGGGAGHDKDSEASEDVDGKEGGPEVGGQAGPEEGHQPKEPLEAQV